MEDEIALNILITVSVNSFKSPNTTLVCMNRFHYICCLGFARLKPAISQSNMGKYSFIGFAYSWDCP